MNPEGNDPQNPPPPPEPTPTSGSGPGIIGFMFALLKIAMWLAGAAIVFFLLLLGTCMLGGR